LPRSDDGRGRVRRGRLGKVGEARCAAVRLDAGGGLVRWARAWVSAGGGVAGTAPAKSFPLARARAAGVLRGALGAFNVPRGTHRTPVTAGQGRVRMS
jgi:hypothetical protein